MSRSGRSRRITVTPRLSVLTSQRLTARRSQNCSSLAQGRLTSSWEARPAKVFRQQVSGDAATLATPSLGGFARFVARLRPAVFVFENVEGFFTAEGGSRIIELLDPLIKAGYRIHLRKINAANFGVPQHRKRVIAIGALGWDPQYPEPTHSAYGAPGARLARVPLTADSDSRRGVGQSSTSVEGCSRRTRRSLFCPPEGAGSRKSPSLRPGQTMRDLPEAYWHDSYRRRAFRRVKDGTPTEKRGGAPAGLRRLRLDEPSKAVTGGGTKRVHPSNGRSVSDC